MKNTKFFYKVFNFNHKRNLTILVSPLNWGLGHASRDVPIVRALISAGHKVIIAADKSPLILLRNEFPKLQFILTPSFDIKYSDTKSMFFIMMQNIPKIVLNIYRENILLKKIIRKYNIDIVISDNRYGMWNKNVYSIFITHQIFIKMPKKLKFLEKTIFKINMFFINKYNRLWIPDFEGNNNLSGDLSHKIKIKNSSFIGTLSRFNKKSNTNKNYEYDIIAILSGPEPQRTVFENIIIKQVIKTNYRTLIVKGKPLKKINYKRKNIEFVAHLNTYEMKKKIDKSKYIICRSGYTSIMDLISLQRKAILVATPGQTEQEYLAVYLTSKLIFYSVKQKDFCLLDAIKKITYYNMPFTQINKKLLINEIKKLNKLLL